MVACDSKYPNRFGWFAAMTGDKKAVGATAAPAQKEIDCLQY